jgi:hypothetical protein
MRGEGKKKDKKKIKKNTLRECAQCPVFPSSPAADRFASTWPARLCLRPASGVSHAWTVVKKMETFAGARHSWMEAPPSRPVSIGV